MLTFNIEKFLHGSNYRSDNKFIEFKTDNFQCFHITLKVIFDYLACLYIIRKLQDESFILQSLSGERHADPEKFYLSFDKYINSISVEISFGRLEKNDKILVKSDKTVSYAFSLHDELKEWLTQSKAAYLDFKLQIPNEDYNEIDDKQQMEQVYEQFFVEKVRHKFYWWKYIKGFINIFCTPIYRHLKPYELLNIELQQNQPGRIVLIRRNEELQRILDHKKLYLEVLLQTLEVKRFNSTQADVSFTIRLHDKGTKEYADIQVVSRNRFSEILIAEKETSNPVNDILTYMTMSIKEVKELTASLPV